MSSPPSTSGAAATLSNWEGRIAVESSAVLTLYKSGVLQRARPHPHRENGDNNTSTLQSSHYGYNAFSESDREESEDEDHTLVKPSSEDLGEMWRSGPNNPRAEHYNHRSPNHSSVGTAIGLGDNNVRQPSSRHTICGFSRHTTMGSSLLGDSMTEIDIERLQSECEPTSALLDYCKRKFLRPYMIILSLVGLSPISTDTTTWRTCFSFLQAFLVLGLLLFGYLVQYLCLYRGDRGVTTFRTQQSTESEAEPPIPENPVATVGEMLFSYIIPNTLHLLGFISAVFVCKILDHEQQQNLIERVFLMSMEPKRLCRMLWTYISCGLGLFCILFTYLMLSIMWKPQLVQVKWLAELLVNWQILTKLTLLGSILLQDLVEIVVISSYCIECYLLRTHLMTLSQKLLMHSIESLDWMREMLEFRKLLDHLNQRVAVPVCFFIVMNLAYAFSGIVFIFRDFDYHYSEYKIVALNIVNVLLWLLMGLLPFFMAASITRHCQTAQASGHHIRVRPFVYHNTTPEDLNSMLLFASSLNMSAKLCFMPIQPNYLCFAILVISVMVLTLGMCFNLLELGDS